MITARLPAPPRCTYPCALCGEPPAQHLPKKTRKDEARCERCYRFRSACSLAKFSGEDRGREAKNDADGQLAKVVFDAVSAAEAEAGPTYRALSEAIGVSSSHAAVDHIRLLEKKGLVERSDDRRSWVVSAAGLRALKWKRRPAA